MSKDAKPQSGDAKFETLFRRGSQLLHRGRVNEALPLLEEAHTSKPEHFDASLNLSGAYILAKKFKLAVTILEKLSHQTPDNVMVWTNLGAAYLGNPILARDEDQLQAIAAFKKAIALDPMAPNVAYNLGLVYRDRREYDQAIAWFERALQANPNDRDAQQLIAKLEAKDNPS